MERLPKIAGAGPLADYSIGQRVMTREGIPGVINDLLEGPGGLTTYWVTLDGGLGGGEYAEAEVWPETTSTAARTVDASVEHTAADDYPELGSILSDRLPPALRTVSSLDEAAQILALTLAPKPSSETDVPEGTDPAEQQGYRDGVADGRAGVTRNPQDPNDRAYRAGYDRGWAFGVQSRRQPIVEDLDEQRLLDDQQVAGLDPVLTSKEGGFWSDMAAGDSSNPKYDGFRSYDWCRYRRDHHCFYSKDLDVEASKEAGYAIWIPEDRGVCPRKPWSAQQACSMALPGKNVPGGFVDATVPWDQGGQRGGAPSDVHRTSALDPSLAFHLTSVWKDVQNKAKRIRQSGGVRVVAAKNGTVVGHIKGDHDVYESEIVRVPGRKSIGSWACGCKWGSYSWGRSGPWKKFEGRMCSHTLALQYEAQARGMFDRGLTLDESQPTWMDDSTTVRTPGSYNRDKGRYASYRPVEDQTPDDRPLAALVASMQAEGSRYVEVREFAVACGVRDVPGLVREARKTKSFPAKVRGLIRNLFIDDDGSLFDEATQREVAVRDVLFPNWDPAKGIQDYRGEHEASLGGCGCGGSCGCGGTSHTASPVDDYFFREVGDAKTLPEAAKMLLALARREEPNTTRTLQELAGQNHGKMVGLEHRFKSEGSLLRKMTAEQRDYRSPGACAMGMSDPLRYTITFGPDQYTEDVKDVVEGLERRGFGTRVKNYWLRGDAYNGVNVALTTPNGFPMELQFHTDESLRVKEEVVHPIYEKWRVETDSNRKAIMSTQMRDAFDMVPRPAGSLSISDLKRQPMVPYNQIQWFPRAASAEGVGYRYLLLEPSDAVVRVCEDGSSTEVWRDGRWVEDPAYGTYVFLGDPGSEEISEQQAYDLLGGFMPEVSYAHDSFAFAPAHSVLATSDEARDWGDPGAHEDMEGETFLDPPYDDDPEAALPVTYGDDEAEQHEAAARLAKFFTEEEIRAVGREEEIRRGMSAEEILSEQARAASLVEQVDAFVAGLSDVNPLAHLGLEGGSVADNEIQAAAQQHLAKEALKTYSPAEKKQIIDEGLDVEASNLDLLDIKGTHYEALQAATAKVSALADAEDMWMMDGDPNGTD